MPAAMVPPSSSAPSTPSPTKARRASTSSTSSSSTAGGFHRGRKGTLTLTIRGARNLKAPTPELLGGRPLPRPLRDCVLVASPAGPAAEPASWESLPKPALAVAPIWGETLVFTGVPCPAPHGHGPGQHTGPPLRLHLLYRDVAGQAVARWEALPIDPDTWRAAAASTQERWLPLYTAARGSPSASPTKSRSPTPVVGPDGRRRGSIGGSGASSASGGSPSKQQPQGRHAYVGDLLVAVKLVPDRPAPRLRYRRPWRAAARVLQLPPRLLLPGWLRGSLVGSIGWFTDGLLAASEALRLVPRQRAPSAAAARALEKQAHAAGDEDGEDGMAGVPRLNIVQKLFYLSTLFVALASVSLGASLALVVAAGLFPVVTLLVFSSLLAVVGLGLPALIVVGFVVSAPPVRRRLLEPAILRFRFTRAVFLEDAAGAAEEEEIGMEEQEQEQAGKGQAVVAALVAEKAAA